MSTTTPAIPRGIRRSAGLVGAAAVLLALPGPALALDPGVNYDPSSPAGREYAIPLAEGRAEGVGTSDQRGAANVPFGVGITPPGGRGGGGGRGGPGGRGASASGAAGKTAVAASRGIVDVGGLTPPQRRELKAQLANAEEPGGTGVWTVGVALAVLFAAGLLALLMSNRPEERLG